LLESQGEQCCGWGTSANHKFSNMASVVALPASHHYSGIVAFTNWNLEFSGRISDFLAIQAFRKPHDPGA
jgi:hypothetical protein